MIVPMGANAEGVSHRMHQLTRQTSALNGATAFAPYCFPTFAQVSRKPIVRLRTSLPGVESWSRQK